MLPRERLEIIKNIVKIEKKLYVSKLSEKFNVTEETIRRDLEKLEKEGLVTRTYGGAILNSNTGNEDIQFPRRTRINEELKRDIVLKALEYIAPGITIAADSSTTVLELLSTIKNRNDVTVITNSVEGLMELSDSYVNVLATGGNLKQNLKSLQGPITKNTLLNYNVDITLLSCNAIDMKKGILEANEAESEIKKIMKKQADKTILLVDHTKFNKSSLVKMFDFKDLDIIITDREPDEEWKEFLNKNKIEVVF
ncbi:transcriptional regulator, DeoR family [Clostridium sp. DSM 8431]|uniref:DeoR/GlpR family DNA-binding transcription regulator n=1 Tax=Clostridium sp. DSM 8431 TaxID=1761781 RepID=UPI0008F341D8|nr:DeoR/GlpR family DNA-binding transcription regulator [Clostridium sp. DSM 8431]SFU51401.1 transcriptional regulator, DeoR family [Clostridium sp. DSM 8431]